MKINIKTLFLAFITIIIILISGLFIRKYLYDTTKDFLTIIQKTEVSLTGNDYKKAYISINEIDMKWEKTEKIWALFIYHHEIDDITINIKSAKEYIEAIDKASITLGINQRHSSNQINVNTQNNIQNNNIPLSIEDAEKEALALGVPLEILIK